MVGGFNVLISASHRSRQRIGRVVALNAAFGLSLAVAGCYTLLRHPPSSEATFGFTGECARCHDASGAVETGYAPWMDYFRYSRAGWMNYYGSPHWLDSRWARVPKGQPESPEQTSERIGWGRVPSSSGEASDGATRIREPHLTSPVPAPVVGAPGAPAAPPTPTTEGAQPQEPRENEEPKSLPSSGRGLRR